MAKKISKEVKDQVVRYHKDKGRSFAATARKFNVAASSVSLWCKQAREVYTFDIGELTPSAHFLSDKAKLRQENDHLKTLLAFYLGQNG